MRASAEKVAACLDDVRVSYPSHEGPVDALSGISFACEYGTSTAIIGRSGSGKSTLISVLSMLRTPTSGTVTIDGRDVAALPRRERDLLRAEKIGVVFQSFHLEPSLSVLDNTVLPWTFGATRANRRAAMTTAVDVLEQVGIADLARRRPNALSGGQRQRVAIARALFTRPAVFVADEPTGNLDEDTANSIAELLLSLPERFGSAVVLVTHDHAVAARAQRTLTITHGRFADE